MKTKILISSFTICGIIMIEFFRANAQSSQWVWMKGDSVTNVNGIYGMMGVRAATSKPGSREGAVSWTDASGSFWLFGGQGYAASGVPGALNDLWKYEPGNNSWIWMNGDSLINMNAGANNPGA